MAKDIYHDLVKQALENEGWTITHDPYFLYLGIGRRRVAADFAAEKFITAQKGTEKILVEIKSFITSSNIYEFHHSVGQYDFLCASTGGTGTFPYSFSGYSAGCL